MIFIYTSFAFILGVGLGLAISLLFRKRKPIDTEFQRECKMAMRGHLKASILFWIYFYRTQKGRSKDSARREIFSDLKQEFSDVRWMESILEDIRQEITRSK